MMHRSAKVMCSLAGSWKTLGRRLVLGLLIWLVVPPCPVHSQGLLTDSAENPKQYMIQVSGTVGSERFTGVRGVLLLDSPPPLSPNDYLVILKGFPQTNSRNTFYWFSEDSPMTVLDNEITCAIKNVYLNPPDIHFHFLSPTLLENKGPFLTHRDRELRREAEQKALPTRVFAQAGKLVLRFVGSDVSGTVWMKGYDRIEHAYVEYRASFSGRKNLPIEPRQEFRK